MLYKFKKKVTTTYCYKNICTFCDDVLPTLSSVGDDIRALFRKPGISTVSDMHLGKVMCMVIFLKETTEV